MAIQYFLKIKIISWANTVVSLSFSLEIWKSTELWVKHWTHSSQVKEKFEFYCCKYKIKRVSESLKKNKFEKKLKSLLEKVSKKVFNESKLARLFPNYPARFWTVANLLHFYVWLWHLITHTTFEDPPARFIWRVNKEIPSYSNSCYTLL